MKATAYRVYRYRLPFRKPVLVNTDRLTEREGLLLCLEGPGGGAGWGEVAPLPGFSPETLHDALAHVKEIAQGLLGQCLEMQDLRFAGHIPRAAPASVRFGVEGALLGLAASSGGRAWPEGPPGPLSLCRLLPDWHVDPCESLARAANEGFTCVKLKVGRRALRDELAAVGELASPALDRVRMRFDANRAWSLQEARAFCAAIEELPVEYVEEPLADPSDWDDLASTCHVPTAIDESLALHGASLLARPGEPRWVVLKPSLVGGVSGTTRLAGQARASGRRVVVSSMYESGVGFRQVARMAAALQEPGTAAGLDTMRTLAEDVVEPRPIPKRGQLELRGPGFGPVLVKTDRLEYVTGG